MFKYGQVALVLCLTALLHDDVAAVITTLLHDDVTAVVVKG